MIGSSSTGAGVSGSSEHSNAIEGRAASDGTSGVYGENTRNGYGVAGRCASGAGLLGDSANGTGIKASGGQYAGHFDGTVLVNGVLQVVQDIQLVGADCAEVFKVSGARDDLAGSVLVVADDLTLTPCSQSYDKRVAGVAAGAGSFRPGIILGVEPDQTAGVPVALLGRTFCRVDATTDPIEVGDLLTTSDNPGHAMVASDRERALGSILGKALAPLRSGRAMIPILVALQ